MTSWFIDLSLIVILRHCSPTNMTDGYVIQRTKDPFYLIGIDVEPNCFSEGKLQVLLSNDIDTSNYDHDNIRILYKRHIYDTYQL